jgi:hypothetical protein
VDNYWAYQPIRANLPADLDFGPTECTVASTVAFTREFTYCASSYSSYPVTLRNGTTSARSVAYCGRPTSTEFFISTRTEVWVGIENTRTVSSSSTLPTTIYTVTSESLRSTITATAQLQKRVLDPGPSTDKNTIQATVSMHTDTLVIFPAAPFLSVTIVILLIICTAIIYLVQYSQLRLLPRDFDSPASLLAALYVSEKLKTWAERQQERCMIAAGDNSRKRSRAGSLDEEITVKMGYFTGNDRREHWGIEVIEDYPQLLEDSRLEDEGTMSGQTASSHGRGSDAEPTH